MRPSATLNEALATLGVATTRQAFGTDRFWATPKTRHGDRRRRPHRIVALLFRIAVGQLLGPDQPTIRLRLLEIEPALEGR